ncbi:hypothetical protein HMPREF0880_02032 [Yokenella regensburgei ATCC 43003]|nr:hypothetical protein HMPREF0880_02032 [Yokenella regensburgei ATCC 43003]
MRIITLHGKFSQNDINNHVCESAHISAQMAVLKIQTSYQR